jgi:hypothetical protein
MWFHISKVSAPTEPKNGCLVIFCGGIGIGLKCPVECAGDHNLNEGRIRGPLNGSHLYLQFGVLSITTWWVCPTLGARGLCIYPVYQGLEYKLFYFKNLSMCRIMTSFKCNCMPWVYTVTRRGHSSCSVHCCAATWFNVKHLPQKNDDVFHFPFTKWWFPQG